MWSESLYPFQVEAAAFHMKHRYTLNCSAMGLGKSRMALATAVMVGMDVTVFCPAFLKPTWQRECKDAGIKAEIHSYTMLHNVKETSGFWIIDECHALKNPSAKRTQTFYKMLKERKPDYLIGLTGTPIKNRVPDFWTLLAFMSQVPVAGINGKALEGSLQKYYNFCRHFCKVNRMAARGRSFEKFHGIQEQKIPELKALLKDKFIRFEVDKVLKDLPPMTRKYVEMSLEPSEELKELFDAYVAGSKVDITGKVKSAALKADFTAAYVAGILEESDEESVLVFSDHIEAAKRIHSGVPSSALITGATSMKERQVIMDYFQAKKIRCIVATIGALSTGVTLHAARHVVFNDLNWTPSENEQAEKRIHRIGQKNACFAHYVVASETDYHIMRILNSKLETVSKVLNG